MDAWLENRDRWVKEALDRTPPRVPLSRAAMAADPDLAWNAYAALTNIEIARLSPAQKPARLASDYASEVVIGGHWQFFVHTPGKLQHVTLDSLNLLGASSYASLLDEALRQWERKPRSAPKDEDEPARLELQAEFAGFDSRFEELRPELLDLIRAYVMQRLEAFIEVVE
jgi:hypothetical protein